MRQNLHTESFNDKTGFLKYRKIKIKTDDNQAKFLEISKTMKHSTRKP